VPTKARPRVSVEVFGRKNFPFWRFEDGNLELLTATDHYHVETTWEQNKMEGNGAERKGERRGEGREGGKRGGERSRKEKKGERGGEGRGEDRRGSRDQGQVQLHEELAV
jgi:hypothetical protein